ncbi:short chain dehydrogenase reductase [Pseudomassariella vexata]|uniref:Short chain dehydrogenase reductase n=1 Tax=Pseudomassariella vexata TaxID=1141098 RepID=A0A1Y2DC97_9PEZI|nr:short chain dehydrogenase reductase [Pseudomassariella vexata]ORY56891.1 short chain dehydrogenase reductase [Pseudomassariella vexata]
MSNQPVALITGANGSLGAAIASILATIHGYHVFLAARTLSTATELAQSLTARGLSASSVQLDLTSDASIHTAVATIKATHPKLDVLINNAAVLLELQGTDLSTRDLLNATFQPNVFGTAVLTEACLPLLRLAKNPRIVFVSSRNGSITQTLDRNWAYHSFEVPAYKASKAALNMIAMRYMTKLEDVGGMVNMVCPGLVKSKMVEFHPDGREPEEAADKVVELAILREGGVTGTFTDADGVVPW